MGARQDLHAAQAYATHPKNLLEHANLDAHDKQHYVDVPTLRHENISDKKNVVCSAENLRPGRMICCWLTHCNDCQEAEKHDERQTRTYPKLRTLAFGLLFR